MREGFGIHLAERGSDLWRERLAFRDALRASPELRAEYAEWKCAHGGGKPYYGEQDPARRRVLARAGIPLKPDSERLSPVS